MVKRIIGKEVTLQIRSICRVRRYLYFGLDIKWRHEAEMEYIKWKTAKKRVGKGVIICMLCVNASQCTSLNLQIAPVVVEYSDQPEWGQLTVPNFHGPLAVHFLVLCCAMVAWVVEMVLHSHFKDSCRAKLILIRTTFLRALQNIF